MSQNGVLAAGVGFPWEMNNNYVSLFLGICYAKRTSGRYWCVVVVYFPRKAHITRSGRRASGVLDATSVRSVCRQRARKDMNRS